MAMSAASASIKAHLNMMDVTLTFTLTNNLLSLVNKVTLICTAKNRFISSDPGTLPALQRTHG